MQRETAMDYWLAKHLNLQTDRGRPQYAQVARRIPRWRSNSDFTLRNIIKSSKPALLPTYSITYRMTKCKQKIKKIINNMVTLAHRHRRDTVTHGRGGGEVRGVKKRKKKGGMVLEKNLSSTEVEKL